MAETTVTLFPIQAVSHYSEEYFQTHFPARYGRSLRFRQEADRLRCLAAGILLREVLGAEEAEFSLSPGGKLFLPGSSAEFNLSHSGDYAALAVSSLPVGVDMEPIGRDHTDAARKVFTDGERRWMEESPVSRFASLWTMKEALAKALGIGLSLPFREIEVLGLINGESLAYEGRTFFGQTGQMRGYVLSVCTEKEKTPVTIRLFREVTP